MAPITSAVQQAAETLQRIAESTEGERAKRATVVALVLRAVEAFACGAGTVFLRLRAEAEVERVPSAGERAMLWRLVLAAEARGVEALSDQLVTYACELERMRRLPEADAVMTLALATSPDRAEVALHAGRVARMQGDADRALELYRRARRLDERGSIGRLAAVGEAVVSTNAERALSVVIREAVRAGDHETAAVALEERARVRRSRNRRRAAARDLCTAAARFPDAVDRARVAHELADLCIAINDGIGAREALLVALEAGDPSQREHATSRLHTVSRDLGDQLGQRRWRSMRRPALVSLSARRDAPASAALGPDLARWRARVPTAAS